MASMRSCTGSSRQIARLALAAAQAIGLAVKLLEWKNILRAVFGKMRLINGIRGSGDRQRDDAAGQTFGHAQYIRLDAGLLAGEDGAGAAPSGHHLVGNEQHIMRAADRGHSGQDVGAVDFHAARAEDQRLDDQRRRRAFAVLQKAVQLVERCLFRPGFRESYGADIEQQRRIGLIEHTARADRHRADGIAVIAMFHHQNFVAGFAPIMPIAKRHFERDLDGRRPAVGKENMVERSGAEIRQARRPVARAGSCVQPAKMIWSSLALCS